MKNGSKTLLDLIPHICTTLAAILALWATLAVVTPKLPNVAEGKPVKGVWEFVNAICLGCVEESNQLKAMEENEKNVSNYLQRNHRAQEKRNLIMVLSILFSLVPSVIKFCCSITAFLSRRKASP